MHTRVARWLGPRLKPHWSVTRLTVCRAAPRRTMAMDVRRTIFIGDVHGCCEELRLLLEKCEVAEGDEVVCVGDFVGKGPDSDGVLTLCRERGIKGVLGNHDHLFLCHVDGDPTLTGRLVPEYELLATTASADNIAYLRSLPLWYRPSQLPDVLVVHAGMLPNVRPEDMDPDMLMNIRCVLEDGTPTSKAFQGTPWVSLWEGPETVVFGHDAQRGLQVTPLAVGLDTGACYGGALTAYILPGASMVQVKALDVYKKPTGVPPPPSPLVPHPPDGGSADAAPESDK